MEERLDMMRCYRLQRDGLMLHCVQRCQQVTLGMKEESVVLGLTIFKGLQAFKRDFKLQRISKGCRVI